MAPAGFPLEGKAVPKAERGKNFVQVRMGGKAVIQVTETQAPKFGPLLPAQALLHLGKHGASKKFLEQVKKSPLFKMLLME